MIYIPCTCITTYLNDKLHVYYTIFQGIEQLKKEQATWEKKSKWLSLKSVFGHPFNYRWFSPFHNSPLVNNDYHSDYHQYHDV